MYNIDAYMHHVKKIKRFFLNKMREHYADKDEKFLKALGEELGHYFGLQWREKMCTIAFREVEKVRAFLKEQPTDYHQKTVQQVIDAAFEATLDRFEPQRVLALALQAAEQRVQAAEQRAQEAERFRPVNDQLLELCQEAGKVSPGLFQKKILEFSQKNMLNFAQKRSYPDQKEEETRSRKKRRTKA